MTSSLVTGASGFIGQELARSLKATDDDSRLIGIDRRSRPRADSSLDHFVQDDLVTMSNLDDVLEGVDTVFHLAAAKSDWGESAEDYQRDNVVATRRLIEAGRVAGVRRWIFFSSVSALGSSTEVLDECSTPQPVGPYGESKLECELMYRDLVQETGCDVLVIKPSVVFGPQNPANTNIFRLIDAVRKRRFVMVGSGETIKTTSFVDNLVAATMHLFQLESTGYNDYIYVDEPKITTAELVSHIRRRLGRSGAGLRVPENLVVQPARLFDVAARVLSIDLPITSDRIRKFCRSTDFSSAKIQATGFVQPIALSTAIERTIDWHLQTQ